MQERIGQSRWSCETARYHAESVRDLLLAAAAAFVVIVPVADHNETSRQYILYDS